MTPAVKELEALISRRKEIAESAYHIGFSATQWEEDNVPHSERAQSLAQLKQLRDDLEAQTTLQNAACVTINVSCDSCRYLLLLTSVQHETTAAFGAPPSLPYVPGTNRNLCDLLEAATQYALLDRFGALLEEVRCLLPTDDAY